MGASSFSPSPMTTTPSIGIMPSALRIASTAAPSAVFLSPRPIQRALASAPASVTRTSSRARLRLISAETFSVARSGRAIRYACDVPASAPAPTLAGGPPEGRKVETTSQPPVKLPSWPRARTVRGARAILQTFIIFPLMGAFSPLTVIDRYRVKTIKGGAIFVSNHSSALDAVVMLQALPSRFRFRAFVVAAADSIFKRKWEAMLTELLINTFPIPRAGGARPALDRLKEHLSHGWSVVIFPEGTLSRTGNIGTFKKGAAILAIDAGVPIVPAYVDGLYEVFPRFRRIPAAIPPASPSATRCLRSRVRTTTPSSPASSRRSGRSLGRRDCFATAPRLRARPKARTTGTELG